MSAARDLVVLGGGPGGYTAALRAAQLGMQVTLVEKDELGGVCGNWGCIPSKAIIHSADVYDQARQGAAIGIQGGDIGFDFGAIIDHSRAVAAQMAKGVGGLLRRAGVEVIHAEARLDGEGGLRLIDGTAVPARHVLLAAGTGEMLLPGIELDAPRVVTSRELLAERTLPASLLVLGGGAIGIEFAFVFLCLGVDVTIVEMQGSLLPGMDPDVAKEIERSLRRRGATILTGTRFESLTKTDSGVRIEVEGAKGKASLAAERLLVAVGRVLRPEGIGLDVAGIALEAGRVIVDDAYWTSRIGVLAVGDLIDSPALAHVASAEGVAAVEILAGVREPGRLDRRRLPACVYGRPEVAVVGLSEAEARAAGAEVKTGMVRMRALGRAVAAGETEGFVKLVIDARYGEIIGCQIVAPGATDLIAEVVLAMQLEGTAHELAATIHPHPTFAEALMEAAHSALGMSLNA
ncbi:MAG: dihydrolipoyl dehydrogenase [Deltaproteobacteria bacterium]